jgi:hypothetical protein
VSNPVHCYLVDWAAFVERAAANRTAEGLDWFWWAAKDREPWVICYADLVPEWDSSSHRRDEHGLAYDDFAEALDPGLRARLDRFFHTLLPSSVEDRRVELPAGGPWRGFHAAVSPPTVAELRAVAAGLDFGALCERGKRDGVNNRAEQISCC